MSLTLDYAIVGLIVRQLRENGSWCGETHIQKAAYVAKAVFGVPLSADFVLYKHGPFSFDLNAILSSMRADKVLSLVPQGHYGPSIKSEPAMEFVFKKFEGQLSGVGEKIEKVAKFFGSKNVADLERLATAIFVSLKIPGVGPEARAAELNRLKPHIPLASALQAVSEADRFLEASGTMQRSA
jgi:uncharacterized protein YwgA